MLNSISRTVLDTAPIAASPTQPTLAVATAPRILVAALVVAAIQAQSLEMEAVTVAFLMVLVILVDVVEGDVEEIRKKRMIQS